jgi:hypothetical protein
MLLPRPTYLDSIPLASLLQLALSSNLPKGAKHFEQSIEGLALHVRKTQFRKMHSEPFYGTYASLLIPATDQRKLKKLCGLQPTSACFQ